MIHDFAGPYYVSKDNLAFGQTHKYVVLKGLQDFTPLEYDSAINKSNEDYKKMMHNLFCNNCHSHVARALNYLGYNGSYRSKEVGVKKNRDLDEGDDQECDCLWSCIPCCG